MKVYATCQHTAARLAALQVVFCAELGIDIPGILKRSTCIASSRTRNLDLEGLDLGGPLIFVLLLACIHLLVSILTEHCSPSNAS